MPASQFKEQFLTLLVDPIGPINTIDELDKHTDTYSHTNIHLQCTQHTGANKHIKYSDTH